MTLFIVALQREALPLIGYFGLQKNETTPFILYRNDSIVLIISGMGTTASAVATAYGLLHFTPTRIINFGLAGTSDSRYIPGELYAIDKLIDTCSDKVYHLHTPADFAATSLHTFPHPQTKKVPKVKLVDMEASGFYEAAVKFLSKKQILIIKIISDKMEKRVPEEREIKTLMQRHLPLLQRYIGDY